MRWRHRARAAARTAIAALSKNEIIAKAVMLFFNSEIL